MTTKKQYIKEQLAEMKAQDKTKKYTREEIKIFKKVFAIQYEENRENLRGNEWILEKKS